MVGTRTAGCDITSSKRHFTFCAYEIQTSKIIALAERTLFSPWPINREEFRSNNFTAVLQGDEEGKKHRRHIAIAPGI